MGGSSGSTNGGKSDYTSGGGGLAGVLINSAVSLYSGYEAQKANKKASNKQADAMRAAEARQDAITEKNMLRQEEMANKQAARDAEALIPIGESATIDFGGQNDTTGSTADFLVPKFGGSQLGTKTKSGLGV